MLTRLIEINVATEWSMERKVPAVAPGTAPGKCMLELPTGYNLSATETDGLGYSTFNLIAFPMPAATVFDNVRVEFVPAP